MAITRQQVIEAVKQAKHNDGSRGLAYIAGTRVIVEVEGVYNSRTSTTPWSFVYTLIDPSYPLNGNRCFGQKGQASFVDAATRWLNSEKRNGQK
jgi:hypothetical protein